MSYDCVATNFSSPEANEEEVTPHCLHGDYPEPLTAAQRASFQRHVAKQVHRYSVIHRTMEVVRRGWNSLHQLVQKLENERSELQRFLERDDGASVTTARSTPTLDTLPHVKRDGEAHSNTNSYTGGTVDTATKADAPMPRDVKSTPMVPPRRRAGGLQRSAMFANLQSVLQTANKQVTENYSHIGHARERIAKQTRLSLVLADLSQQRELQAPLQAKLQKCVALEQEANKDVGNLLALLDEMLEMETIYPGSFSLQAAATECPEGDSGENSSVLGLCAHSARYPIPFTPARYSGHMEDMVRCQVEDVLEHYLVYRSRVDPILQHLDEQQNNRLVQRVDQLMEVIGLGSSRGKDMVTSYPGNAPVGATLTAADTIMSEMVHADGDESRTNSPFTDAGVRGSAISVPVRGDGTLGRAEERDAGSNGSGVAGSASWEGTGERALIRSALNALDDFEDMY